MRMGYYTIKGEQCQTIGQILEAQKTTLSPARRIERVVFYPQPLTTLVRGSGILGDIIVVEFPIFNLILTLEDMTVFLWPIKKTGYSAINRTEGNLTQDWLLGGRKPSQPFITKRYHKSIKKSRKIMRREK